MTASTTLILNFVVAMIPGAVLMFLLVLWRRPDPTARRSILKIFGLGMVMGVPVAFFNTTLHGAMTSVTSSPVAADLFFFLIVVGPCEEVLKFLIVWFEVYRGRTFETESDGVVFAAASALGFATYENVVYMESFGMQVLVVRGWVCALGHVSFSAIFGHYLGLAKTGRYSPGPCIAEGLFLAAVFHGSYDFIVTRWPAAIYPVVGFLVLYYLALHFGLMVPYLTVFAPGLMRPPVAENALERFLGRRFPEFDRPVLQEKVRALLELLDDLDEDRRLDGLEEAPNLLDARIYEKVKNLRHDPVERVRQVADATHVKMRRSLQTQKSGQIRTS